MKSTILWSFSIFHMKAATGKSQRNDEITMKKFKKNRYGLASGMYWKILGNPSEDTNYIL